MHSADFDRADFDRADLDSADHDRADFDRADLDSADHDSADHDSADFDRADHDRADFDSAAVDSADINAAPVDSALVDDALIGEAFVGNAGGGSVGEENSFGEEPQVSRGDGDERSELSVDPARFGALRLGDPVAEGGALHGGQTDGTAATSGNRPDSEWTDGGRQPVDWQLVDGPVVAGPTSDAEPAVAGWERPPVVAGFGAGRSVETPGDDAYEDGSYVDDGSYDETDPMSADFGARLVSVPVSAIEPNEFQPRTRFVDDELLSLAASIVEVGVLQPVLVREIDDGRYELIAGERRWRASQLAGLDEIPAVVRLADDRTSLEQAVIENLHRADLGPLEEASAYRQLVEEFGLTQESVAQRVGKSRSAVANLIRLFQLPPTVQRLIASEQLGAGHARALLAFPDPAFQEELARRAAREGLTVRKVEQLVRAASQRTAEQASEEGPSVARSTKSAAFLALEELLGDRLDTRVDVSGAGAGGRIVVAFADGEDLNRVAELLLGPEKRAPEVEG